MKDPPRPIPIHPYAIDLEDRANHLQRMLMAVAIYVTAILDDTAQNVPGGLHLVPIEALLSDLASEVNGTLHNAADALPGRRA